MTAAPEVRLNILALGQRRRQQVAQYFDQLEGIWSEYKVYLGKGSEA